MTVASEEKLIRRWVEQLRPFGRGRTYTPALRLRILAYIELAKATGMAERECCKSIGVSPTSIAAWRRADREAVMPEVSEQPSVPLEFSVEPVSRALVPVEVPQAPVQLGGGLSLHRTLDGGRAKRVAPSTAGNSTVSPRTIEVNKKHNSMWYRVQSA